jgi:phage terminase large subunit
LQRRDPGYRKRLAAQGEVTSKQLLEGDWDAFEGQYFPEWNRDIHIVSPFEVPKWWKGFRSLDYGLDCTACIWWRVDQQGKLYAIREIWQPNLNLSQAVEAIRNAEPPLERDGTYNYTVASPDLWNRQQDRGVSGREIMSKKAKELHFSLALTNADDRRIPGWRAMREYMQPYEDEYGEETALLQVFSHCTHLINDIPLLLHDENEPEDAADEPHKITHSPESARYGIMSRPPAKSLTPEERYERDERNRKLRTAVNEKTGY